MSSGLKMENIGAFSYKYSIQCFSSCQYSVFIEVWARNIQKGPILIKWLKVAKNGLRCVKDGPKLIKWLKTGQVIDQNSQKLTKIDQKGSKLV